MEKTIKIGKITFKCKSETDNIAFHHEVKAFYRGKQIGEATIQYWNRTRERRDFQSAILECINHCKATREMLNEAYDLASNNYF